MRHSCFVALVVGVLSAGIASPQSIPADLTQYLTLTDAQVQAINTLNTAFEQYFGKQENQYYDLESQANAELAKDSPDAGVVGGLYAQMEMIHRDYHTQLAQVQSKVAAVLTPAQVTLVGGLLNVARLQPLVSEALQVYVEMQTPDFTTGTTGVLVGLGYASCCYAPQMPIALVNYLNLSDAQNGAILNAIQANQEYVSGQSLKIQELQYAVQALTAAQTIDTATLGADYVAVAKIQRDVGTQAGQLVTTVRGVLTSQQQPQLKALDNAMSLSKVESEAVDYNILVLPPDLNNSYSPFGSSEYFGQIRSAQR